MINIEINSKVYKFTKHDEGIRADNATIREFVASPHSVPPMRCSLCRQQSARMYAQGFAPIPRPFFLCKECFQKIELLVSLRAENGNSDK